MIMIFIKALLMSLLFTPLLFGDVHPYHGNRMGMVLLRSDLTPEEHKSYVMPEALAKMVERGTLLMGWSYPNKWKKTPDSKNVKDEREKLETQKETLKRDLLCTFSVKIEEANSKLFWLDVSYGEDSVITERAIEGMSPQLKASMRKQLIEVTVGAPQPISDKVTFEVANIYSKKRLYSSLAF